MAGEGRWVHYAAALLVSALGCVGSAAGSDAGIPPPAPPTPPVIAGEISAGHVDLTWTWTVPPGTATFRYHLDDQPDAVLPASVHALTHMQPATGPVTLQVKGCNAAGACSAPAQFITRVEFLGQDKSPVWRGVLRPMTTTAQGRTVGVSCHNCYAGPNNAVMSAADVAAKVNAALAHGADLIEIDVAEAQGVLYVTHDPVTTPEARPTLDEVLRNPTFSSSDAMLFLELKGATSVTPAQFATLVLDALQGSPYAHNGRLVFVRAFNALLPLLTEIRDALVTRPLLAPYVRINVLYGDNAAGSAAEVLTQLQNDVVANHFHGVEVHFEAPFLHVYESFCGANGLMMGVWTLPGTLGEVHSAALRDQVDQLTGEYRADLLRGVVMASDTAVAIQLLSQPVHSNQVTLSGVFPSPRTEDRRLGVAATVGKAGGPEWSTFALDPLGQALTFQSAAQQALPLWSADPMPPVGKTEGFLLHATVRLDSLTVADNAVVSLLSNVDGNTGVALELANISGATFLRFSVGDGSTRVSHAYPVAGLAAPETGACGDLGANLFTQPLVVGQSYRLVGAYDGNGGVYLFINARCAGTARPTLATSVAPSPLPFMVGAQPMAAAPHARAFLDGAVQQAAVVRWGDHGFSGSAVNGP